jgi:hypothetical protein
LDQSFATELAGFKKVLEREKQSEEVLLYFNDKTDRLMRSIRDTITTNGYDQIYPSAKELLGLLLDVKEKCGSKTERVVRELSKSLRSTHSDEFFQSYVRRLKDSFVQRTVQKKLIAEEKPYLILAYLEE